MKKVSRKEIGEQIEEFFSGVKDKTPKEVKKIKRLAMSKNIKLKDYRKLFCKKCLTPYSGNEKVRINRFFKTIECKNCGKINRQKISKK